MAEKLLSLVSKQQLDRLQGGGGNGALNGGGSNTTPPPALAALLEDVEPEQLAILSRELRESAPQYLPLVGLLGAKFTSSLLETAANNIDGALAQSELENRGTDELTKATARGLSNFAKMSATTISDQVASTVASGDSAD